VVASVALTPGNVAFAIRGFCANASTAARIDCSATAGVASAPSASRRRRSARACNCETRDSFTPSSEPISFIVTSP
jgi:hypothetical protein